MKVKNLSNITKIADKISSPSSLTSLYRAVEIGPDTFRCCSEFGNLEIWLDDPTGINETCLLDTSATLAIAVSLPQDGEITLTKKDNKVLWKCGDAKGHLSLINSDYSIPKIQHTTFPWQPPDNFSAALLLASSACQAAAVSVGLYGIILEPNGEVLRMLSSNTIALAASSIEKGTYPAGKVTLRPPVPGIIAGLIRVCPNCVLDITDQGIFILGEWLVAHLPLGNNLEYDLAEIADRFTNTKQEVKINQLAVKKFIGRARALTDKNASFNVFLKVEDGKLVLEHKGIASSTEQFFLCEGLDPLLKYKTVELPADMLALPLDFTTVAAFDFLNDSRLVLKGENPSFIYIVEGAA